jgi:hypothetical protein
MARPLLMFMPGSTGPNWLSAQPILLLPQRAAAVRLPAFRHSVRRQLRPEVVNVKLSNNSRIRFFLAASHDRCSAAFFSGMLANNNCPPRFTTRPPISTVSERTQHLQTKRVSKKLPVLNFWMIFGVAQRPELKEL